MKWLAVPIGKVCLETGQRDPRTEPDNTFHYVDLSAIDRESKRITKAAKFDSIDAPSRARKEIRTDDVLVSTVRPNLNAVAIVPQELHGEVASTGFCVLRADRSLVQPRFLFYRVQCDDFVRFLVERVTGASYPAVSDGIVKEAPLPLPSLPEQERIVRILDEAEELQKLRAQADRRTADLIPALFHDMFGDSTANTKGWSVASFGEVCECRLGKMLDAKQQTGLQRRPYLRNVNVQWGRFDLSEVLEMDFDEKDRDSFRLCVGDVLICEGGEVGRAAIWNDEMPECYFQKALHRARPNHELAVPEYIQWVMWSLSMSGGLGDFTSQATIAHLTGVKLKSLRIPLPPVSLQREFAARVAEIQAMEAHQAASGRKLDDLFNSLLHSAFQGKL